MINTKRYDNYARVTKVPEYSLQIDELIRLRVELHNRARVRNGRIATRRLNWPGGMREYEPGEIRYALSCAKRRTNDACRRDT